MMKLVLIKSWTNKFGRKYPIGQIMRTDKELGNFLLNKKYAMFYDGDSNTKVKSDFFKPKN
jgi:hypothetical protein